MAREDNVVVPATKKQKWLNYLKVISICLAAVVGIVAAVVLYVWISGGFNPPYVPLSELAFSQTEYVIDKNGKDDLYDTIKLVPNEGCTELDAIITISNTDILQLVADDNVSPYGVDSDDTQSQQQDENQIYQKFNVKINSDIKLRPITKTVTVYNGEGIPSEIEVNVGGWVKLTAEQQTITTECWVFVDVSVEGFNIEIASQDKSTEVYAGSSVNLTTSNYLPLNSVSVPSTNLPYGKTETILKVYDEHGNEINNKFVYFDVSNKEKATIDNTGKLTINQDAEGEFQVSAYIIKTVNALNNIPKLEDYLQYGQEIGTELWNEDFDKIRVWAKPITFTIKEISVNLVTTQKLDTSKDILPEYSVFDQNILIETNHDQTKISDKNNYFVDITLSHETEEYKDYLLKRNLEAYAGYISKASDSNAILIDGSYVVITDKFVSLTKTSPTEAKWNLTVLDYSADQNVIVFAYPNGTEEEPSYLYAYTKIKLNKTEIDSITLSNKIPETKILSLDLTEQFDLGNITINPSNTTYSEWLYFANSTNSVIETDSATKIKINNTEYYLVAGNKQISGQTEFIADNKLVVPTSVGETTIVAVVVKTDINGEYVIDEQSYLIVEHCSDNIIVEITEKPELGEKDVLNSEGVSIINEGNVTVAHGDQIKITINYTGNVEFLERLTVDVSPKDYSYFTVVSAGDEQQLGVYEIVLDAIKVGNTTVKLLDTDGSVIYNFNAEITSTELADLQLTANNSQEEVSLSIKLNSEQKTFEWFVLDDQNKLTSEKLNLNVVYTPLNPSSKVVELAAYILDNGNYVLDTNILEIIDEENFGDVSKMVFNIKKPGTVYVKAVSGLIESNYVKINIVLPEITVEFNKNNQSQEVLSNSESTLSLTSYPFEGYEDYKLTTDTIIDTQKQYYQNINNEFVQVVNPDLSYISTYYEKVLYEGDKYDIYYNNGGNKESIKPFLKFKFAGEYQTSTNDAGTTLTSLSTGVQIKDGQLILADLNKAVMYENIIAYTDFGFECNETQYFTYCLMADYSVEAKEITYLAPNIVDIFTDKNGSNSPAVKITNIEGNKLYVPVGYKWESNLSSSFISQFTYADEVGGTAYAHIYDVLRLSGANEYFNLIGEYSEIALNDNTKIGCLELLNVDQERRLSVKITVGNNGYSYTFAFNVRSAIETDFNYTYPSTPNVLIPEDVYENYSLNEINFVNNLYTVNLSDKLQLNYDSNIIGSAEISSLNLIVENDIDYKIDNNKLYRINTNFVLTTDTDININKQYYVYEIDSYVLVDNPTIANISSYYEKQTEEILYLEILNDNGTWKLQAHENILNILTKLTIKLEVNIKLVSNVSGIEGYEYYTRDYYKINFNA